MNHNWSATKQRLHSQSVAEISHSLRQLMHTEFHWLDVPERVKYKLGVITRRCLYGSAPRYLAACCVPVSTTASRQHLRSAAGHQLVIPSHRFTTYGRRAFSLAGSTFWNSLPRNLRDPSHILLLFLDDHLKHFFSQSTSVHSASEAFAIMRYINWCFTYLLTYLLTYYEGICGYYIDIMQEENLQLVPEPDRELKAFLE